MALRFGELIGSFLLLCSEFPSAWRRKCNSDLHRQSECSCSWQPCPLLLPRGEQPGSERADPGNVLFSHRPHSFCYIRNGVSMPNRISSLVVLVQSPVSADPWDLVHFFLRKKGKNSLFWRVLHWGYPRPFQISVWETEILQTLGLILSYSSVE